MSSPWNNHFPNSLGTLATQKRTAAAARARLQLARTCLTQATEELAPLVEEAAHLSALLNRIYAEMVEAEHRLAQLVKGEAPSEPGASQ